MRLLLISLLVSCLFSLKGYCSGTPGHHRHCSRICATIQNEEKKKVFFERQNSDNPLFFLAADDSDDNDDDEFTSSKKKNKGLQYCNTTISFSPASCLLFSLKNTNRFYKHFSYPSSDEYIFHRQIMI